MEQLRSHCADFHEIRYLKILRKSVEKIRDSIRKSDNINGYFYEYLSTFMVFRRIFLRMRNLSDKVV